jgi:hypothetical protein
LTLYPGFVVQGITTIEPDDDQLEVALASLRSTLWREKAEGEQPDEASVMQYRDFSHLMEQPAYGASGRAGPSRGRHVAA